MEMQPCGRLVVPTAVPLALALSQTELIHRQYAESVDGVAHGDRWLPAR